MSYCLNLGRPAWLAVSLADTCGHWNSTVIINNCLNGTIQCHHMDDNMLTAVLKVSTYTAHCLMKVRISYLGQRTMISHAMPSQFALQSSCLTMQADLYSVLV